MDGIDIYIQKVASFYPDISENQLLTELTNLLSGEILVFITHFPVGIVLIKMLINKS